MLWLNGGFLGTDFKPLTLTRMKLPLCLYDHEANVKGNCLSEAIVLKKCDPKTTLGGICLFKKTLMLYCFCSEAIINQAASLFEQSRLTVDGRELPTWTSQWNPKK